MDAYSILYSLYCQVIRSVLLSMVFSFVIMPVAAVTSMQIDSVLSALDTEIDNRHSYIVAKEKQLILLKNKLANLPTENPVLIYVVFCIANIEIINLIQCMPMLTRCMISLLKTTISQSSF